MKGGKVIVDYKLDVDNEPEGPDPCNEPVIQEEEKKMEFPHLGTYK